MLNIRIKASQIGNLTDARYFAAMGVQWMDFSLDPGSTAYLTPAEVQGIKAWVEGPKIVGSFNIQSAEEILAAAQSIELDSIQIGPFFPKDQLSLLNDYEVIQEIIVEPNSQSSEIIEFAEQRQQVVDLYLLDFDKNGISWEQIKSGDSPIGIAEILFIQQLKPVLIALSFSPDALPQLLRTFPGIGLSLKGGAEEKVGFKSYDELDEIFEALET